MATKHSRETFKSMTNLCYEEDYPELHKEIISLASETKKGKDSYKYETAMKELIDIIPLFADDFPQDTFSQIEELYQNYLENNY